MGSGLGNPSLAGRVRSALTRVQARARAQPAPTLCWLAVYAQPVPKFRELEAIRDVLVVEPDRHRDARGVFIETYRRSWFPLAREMVQANRAERQAGSLVGLHYHLHQADYWTVPRGRARVVLHDLRERSPTDGSTAWLDVDADNALGVFIPPGVAHGFAALTDVTISYLVDSYYDPSDELGVAWDDPEVGADWGLKDPLLSERDQANPSRSAIPAALRPQSGLRG
jgi:dTDP-4-dehydrorhamnose 3,5-epimerase